MTHPISHPVSPFSHGRAKIWRVSPAASAVLWLRLSRGIPSIDHFFQPNLSSITSIRYPPPPSLPLPPRYLMYHIKMINDSVLVTLSRTSAECCRSHNIYYENREKKLVSRKCAGSHPQGFLSGERELAQTSVVFIPSRKVPFLAFWRQSFLLERPPRVFMQCWRRLMILSWKPLKILQNPSNFKQNDPKTLEKAPK